MSGCEAIRERAQAYLDGDLEPTEREHFEAHIGACPPCRRVLSDYRRLFAGLATPGIPAMPATFVAATMARVAAMRRRRQLLQTVAAAAAMIVVGGAALLLVWDSVPSSVLAQVSDLATVELWREVWDAVVGLGEDVVASGAEWLSVVPGGPGALLMVLVMLAADLFLVARWRVLARMNIGNETRVLQ